VHQPDVEAVQRVLAGDSEAFGVLVRVPGVQEGLGHREIGEILECSEGTAKANYFHAVRPPQRKLHMFREESPDHERVR
jgi:hypothetical protein